MSVLQNNVHNNARKSRKNVWVHIARWSMCVVTFLALTALLLLDVMPDNLALAVGSVADEDIRATRDVVDRVNTELLRAEARAQVVQKYYEDTTLTVQAITNLNTCAEALLEARALVRADYEAWLADRKLPIASLPTQSASVAADPQATPAAEPQPTALPLGAQEYAIPRLLLSQCTALLPISLTQTDVRTLLQMEDVLLQDTLQLLQESVQAEMQSGVRTEQVSEVQERLRTTVLGELDKAEQAAMLSVLSAYLQANFFVDEDATELARERAAAEVAEIVYREKQNIVQAGEVINDAQYAMLEDLGLVKTDESEFPRRMIGLAAITAVMLGMLWAYVMLYERDVWNSLRKMGIFSLLMVMTLAGCWATKKLDTHFLPSTIAAMSMAILLNYRCAMVGNLFFSMLVGLLVGAQSRGIMVAEALPAVLSTVAAGTLCIMLCHRASQRGTLVLAGFAIGAAHAVVYAGFDLLLNHPLQVILRDAMLGMAGGMTAAVFSLGLLPVLEMVFKVVTPMKLMELCNANHPLLKRLMMEAPGTYQHSLMVGNLAEAGADAIGANALLVRTAAFYHDLGKLKRPTFFKENQMGGVNPLDAIEPLLAAKIIRSHPVDGCEMARRSRIPQSILDLIMEHQGDTLIAYFYHQAKQQANGAAVNENDYRYPGPTPSTRESAVLMIADTIEAATRALPEKSPEKIAELVDRLINQKLSDGQFRNCAITIGDLEMLSATFRTTLGGIYHERIAYPNGGK